MVSFREEGVIIPCRGAEKIDHTGCTQFFHFFLLLLSIHNQLPHSQDSVLPGTGSTGCTCK